MRFPPETGARRRAVPAILALVLTAACSGPVGPARAERAEPLPEELEGVGITEKLDAQVPLEATFLDDEGDTVALREYLDRRRPVVLNLGYYSCPMLCGLVTNGLMDALRGMKWFPGREFEVVTLSFDPTETVALAAAKKANYIRQLGRPEVAGGWHFLVGRQQEIDRVTEAVGFRYRWLQKQGQFSHAAALIVLTPDGRVSRYLYGIEFDPQTLRLSLVEAAAGRVGSSFDRFLLFCFHYDAAVGRYAPAARNLMRAGGLVMVVVLGGFFAGYLRRERKRRRPAA